MRLDEIPPFDEDGSVRAVIETPRASRQKYYFEPEWNALALDKTLPRGMVFPFDYGFIPGTKGEDGDPLDVIVLMEEPATAGCVINSRIIGVLRGRQTEQGRTFQNDRFLAVAPRTGVYEDVTDVRELPRRILRQAEEFFISYNAMQGRKFAPGGIRNAAQAVKLIRENVAAFAATRAGPGEVGKR